MVKKLSWVIAIEAGVIIVIASFFFPKSDYYYSDFYRYYLPFANGCLKCGFTPYFAQWLLWPLTLVQPALAYPLWTAISVAGFIILCRYTGANPAVVILSFAAMGQFWLGQIDIIIAVGLALALLAPSPYARGLGLVLALVKPQISALPVLMLLLGQPRREIVKVLAAPLVVLTVSLAVYGPTWPLAWLSNSLGLPAHYWRLAASDVWPYGLILIVTPFVFRAMRARLESSLMVSALSTPFFSVYSYVTFIVFRAPWWVLPLSYSWLLLYPWLGQPALRAAWIVPAGLFFYQFYKETNLASLFYRFNLRRFWGWAW